MSEEKQVGKVKFFNPNRYFGFIVREGDNKEIFFHGSGVLEKTPLEEGELVEFEVEEGKKGPNAIKVQRVGEELEE